MLRHLFYDIYPHEGTEELYNHRIRESENHRIIEWFVLEGSFKSHLVQLPFKEQGHLHLDQVAQSPVQSDSECFQGVLILVKTELVN